MVRLTPVVVSSLHPEQNVCLVEKLDVKGKEIDEVRRNSEAKTPPEEKKRRHGSADQEECYNSNPS